MATQLEDLIGDKLVFGIPGTKLTDKDIRLFKETHATGIIFYRINFESPEQIKKLINDLENALERRLLVCVDHEGGRVIMYRDGVTIFPDNLAFGMAGDVELARAAGEISGRELRALGTDINFSPVLDVLTETYSPNIGIRSYGTDWKNVSELGSAYISALQKAGVSATAKHFPGKGHAPVDAHLKLPTINSTWAEMMDSHLKPFIRVIKDGIDVIMSSHPYYPHLDSGANNIVTFSRRIMTDCLRNELGFTGLIASDDLEMGAIKDVCSIDIAAVRATAAGHDLILSCHDEMSQRKVFYGMLEAYKNKSLPIKELEKSVERIDQIKKKRPDRFGGKIGPDPKGKEVAQAVCRKAVQIVQDKNNFLPLSKQKRENVAIIFPELSSFDSKIMIEKEFLDEVGFFKQALQKFGGSHKTYLYQIDPEKRELDEAAALARDSNTTLFFCYDAHLHPMQKSLLSSIQNAAKNLVVILLRDPYDKEFLRPQDAGVTCFGWRRCQIEADLEKIYGEI